MLKHGISTKEKSKESVVLAEEYWDLEIRPKRSWFDIDFSEIWRYRDLMLLFVRRDFIAQYKQTILGPLWHIIQPVLTTIIFLLIFGRIARIPTDGINPILFYMSGITLWNYFAACLTSTSNTFVNNAAIFGKVYFPRIVIPLSIVISNMVRFGIQFFLLLAAMIWFHFNGQPLVLNVSWLLLPLLVVLMAAIGLGLGIIISSLTTKYRDFAVLLTFAVQLGMYATPIAYPMSFLKGKSYGWLAESNPLSAIVEVYRYALFGKGTFETSDILYSITFMIVTLFLGFLIFNRVEKTFMDTV